MLTRIEIDGFKTFDNLKVDLEPFAVIVGPNASGKSNFLDAIRLLSRLATGDLRTAFGGLRGGVREAFRATASGQVADRMRFAVEVLVPDSVVDPWGATVNLKHTRIRYEVGLRRRRDHSGIERLYVEQENALPISPSNDRWKEAVSAGFRQRYFRYMRRKAWLETVSESERFVIYQDQRAGRERPAEAAEATVLSSITSTDFPHLFALREELRSWRFFQINPAPLRKPSQTTDSDILEPGGDNLATVLAAIKATSAISRDGKGLITDIASELSDVIPGVTDLDVIEDTAAREYRIEITMRDETTFSSRVVSDGTLRVLAFLTALHDPGKRGLICFEEPENGVHPGRLRTLITRLRELVTDPDADEDSPLSQLLMTSHSPVVLSLLRSEQSNGTKPGGILWADVVTRIDPEQQASTRRTRIRPVHPLRQKRLDSEGNRPDADDIPISAFEVDEYLNTVDRGG